MIKVKLVGFLDNIDIIAPIMRASYEETEDARIALGVDIYTFHSWEKEDRLITVLAYLEDAVVGLFMCNLYDNVHHKDLVFAESRIFYVAPSARKTPALKVMLQKMEEVCSSLGVAKLHIGSRKESAYFERLGYDKDQITNTKFLGETL